MGTKRMSTLDQAAERHAQDWFDRTPMAGDPIAAYAAGYIEARQFTDADVTAAASAHAAHVTGYSMRDGGYTYTCRCGWISTGPDASSEAQIHRMGLALAAIADRTIGANDE